MTLPLALPGLLAGAVLAWARSLGEFGATITFAGNYPGTTQTMPSLIYHALQSDPDGRPDAEHGPARRLDRRSWPAAAQPMADHAVSAAAGLERRPRVAGPPRRARSTGGPGEVVAVIGPNGAGKTTLLRALAGLVPVDGRGRPSPGSWTCAAAAVRDRRLGYVFQDQSLFPHLTALDNVAFGPRTRGRRPPRRRGRGPQWLDRLGVGGPRRPQARGSSPAARPSGSRSPAPWPPSPALLLLDEPFAGLDVGVATALRIELAAHLAAYDGVALLVTHDALDALTLADRVLVLDEGRVAQAGHAPGGGRAARTEHVARLVGLNVIRERRDVPLVQPQRRHRLARRARRAPPGTGGTGRVRPAPQPHGDAVRLLVAGDHDLIADVTPAATAELGPGPRTRGLAVGQGNGRRAVRRTSALTANITP